jgi:hypothetical protein
MLDHKNIPSVTRKKIEVTRKKVEVSSWYIVRGVDINLNLHIYIYIYVNI